MSHDTAQQSTLTPEQLNNPMFDIYKKLSDAGIAVEYVRSVILWDWWQDELAVVPATRSQVELHLSRTLGISLSSLRNSEHKRAIPNSSASALFESRVEESARFTEVCAALRARVQELEAACEGLIDYRNRNTLNFQLEKADDFINKMRAIIDP